MLPDVWGPCTWNFIHLMTIGYPLHPTEQEKRNYKNFFNSLVGVLPCNKCKYNLSQNLKKYPLTENILASRMNFVRWGIDLHNLVNYHTGKPMLSYSEALTSINNCMKPIQKKNDFFSYMAVGLVILICIYIFFIRKS
jgi:hypothetical protein